jgi:predicted glycoside hydrolase/deacetylase ChbG (UPF0249 family)
MANGGTFDAAISELVNHDVGIGVHLNLADGAALAGPIRGLTDASGRFCGKQLSRASFISGCFDLQQVRIELRAQLQRVLDAGLKVDHLDSHQHMFLFPMLTPLLIELCQQFAIGATRLPMAVEGVRDEVQPQLWVELSMYRHYSSEFRRKLTSTDIFMPHGMLGMALLNRLNVETLVPSLYKLRPGCWELMVHPGDQDAGLEFCGIERQREQHALTSRKVSQVIERCGVQLTTFGAAACIS